MMSGTAQTADRTLVVDIGRPSKALAWVYSDKDGPLQVPSKATCGRGSHAAHTCLACLRATLHATPDGAHVHLGVEAPLVVPLPHARSNDGEIDLHPRGFEEHGYLEGSTHRGWYYGGGATTLAMGLAALSHLFTGLDAKIATDPGLREEADVWVWEAMVSEMKTTEYAPRFEGINWDGIKRSKDVAAAALGWQAYKDDRNAFEMVPGVEHLNIVYLAVAATGSPKRFEGSRERCDVYDARGMLPGRG